LGSQQPAPHCAEQVALFSVNRRRFTVWAASVAAFLLPLWFVPHRWCERDSAAWFRGDEQFQPTFPIWFMPCVFREAVSFIDGILSSLMLSAS